VSGAGEWRPETPELDAAAALDLLRDGDLAIVGRIVGSSNGALVVSATRRCPDPEPDLVATAVYKPIRFERPLVDFPDGTLAAREVAAFVLSEASGWGVAPPTVLRDGPVGPGMVQLWIDPDPSVDRVALALEDKRRLRPMALFDVVANNADRKIGHLLPTASGHVYGCDHGVCFSDEYKLRTVLWQWRGKDLTDEAVEALQRLRRAFGRDGLRSRLGALLSAEEVEATVGRVELMLKHRIHPYPPEDWPAIPWPPV
jgi:hypothetical protein